MLLIEWSPQWNCWTIRSENFVSFSCYNKIKLHKGFSKPIQFSNIFPMKWKCKKISKKLQNRSLVVPLIFPYHQSLSNDKTINEVCCHFHNVRRNFRIACRAKIIFRKDESFYQTYRVTYDEPQRWKVFNILVLCAKHKSDRCELRFLLQKSLKYRRIQMAKWENSFTLSVEYKIIWNGLLFVHNTYLT